VRAFLLGRDRDRLAAAAATLPGAEYELLEADALDTHEALIGGAFDRTGGFDVVILAVGVLGGQAGLDSDRSVSETVMRVNFLGAGSLLLASLGALRRQGRGTMVVLSSVAAERARKSNAIYGAAKAGLDALAQGLADSLAGTGVRMLVVRPGFVRTRMTAGLDPQPFATTAEAVADATLDRTTIVPRRCRRRAPSEARSSEPAPRKFTRITVSDTDRSLSKPACPPRTPTASTTTSKPPARSNALPTRAS